MIKNMPGGMVGRLPRVKICFPIFGVENVLFSISPQKNTVQTQGKKKIGRKGIFSGEGIYEEKNSFL